LPITVSGWSLEALWSTFEESVKRKAVVSSWYAYLIAYQPGCFLAYPSKSSNLKELRKRRIVDE
jgi:hypothetical protein